MCLKTVDAQLRQLSRGLACKLHRFHRNRFFGGGRFASAFTVSSAMQPDLGGTKELGAVRYDFVGRDVTIERVHLPQLRQMWIDDVVAEVYPPR